MESSLRVFPENTPSLNLLRKHGFVRLENFSDTLLLMEFGEMW